MAATLRSLQLVEFTTLPPSTIDAPLAQDGRGAYDILLNDMSGATRFGLGSSSSEEDIAASGGRAANQDTGSWNDYAQAGKTNLRMDAPSSPSPSPSEQHDSTA